MADKRECNDIASETDRRPSPFGTFDMRLRLRITAASGEQQKSCH
jgi:hypothetical protein